MKAIVHVCDPGQPGKARDFTCSVATLMQGMRYFQDVLQKTAHNRTGPVEISVHCNVAVFEWLLGYCSGQFTRDHISVDRALPLLIASNFLQMDALVHDCLVFMADHLIAVSQHQQERAGPGGDLAALPLELLSRLARMVPERTLEELAVAASADGCARHMPLVNRLYKYKLEGCLRDLRTTLARCSVCQCLFSLADRPKLDCAGPPPHPHHARAAAYSGQPQQQAQGWAQRRSGGGPSVHIPDAAWRLQDYLASLRAQHVAWRGIYWHVWGLVTVLYCHSCMQHVPAVDLHRCTFHPQPPVFAAGAAAQGSGGASGGRPSSSSSSSSSGFFPCCGAAASRTADPRVTANTGCCARDHRLLPSGQGPGSSLPSDLTPGLLDTLRHCDHLFTNPTALLVREAADNNSNAGGVPAASAGTASAAAPASGVAAADGSPRRQPQPQSLASLSLGMGDGSNGGACSATGMDTDGRLIPPAIHALLSSAAAAAASSLQRRGDLASLGPATAATAAALGYKLNGLAGLKVAPSGPGPPPPPSKPQQPSQKLHSRQPPPPPQQQEQQSQQQQQQQQQHVFDAPNPQFPLKPSAAVAGCSSPLPVTVTVTGNPQEDTRIIAAAVVRRLARAAGPGGGVAGGNGGGMVPGGGTADPQHPHPHHQRSPADHARSFTSLAALRQEAEEQAAAAAAVAADDPIPIQTLFRSLSEAPSGWGATVKAAIAPGSPNRPQPQFSPRYAAMQLPSAPSSLEATAENPQSPRQGQQQQGHLRPTLQPGSSSRGKSGQVQQRPAVGPAASRTAPPPPHQGLLSQSLDSSGTSGGLDLIRLTTELQVLASQLAPDKPGAAEAGSASVIRALLAGRRSEPLRAQSALLDGAAAVAAAGGCPGGAPGRGLLPPRPGSVARWQASVAPTALAAAQRPQPQRSLRREVVSKDCDGGESDGGESDSGDRPGSGPTSVNPLLRSVQAALSQQRHRHRQQQHQEQQHRHHYHPQPHHPNQHRQQPPPPQQPRRHQSAGRMRLAVESATGSGSLDDSATDSERRALIEQYKTQRVLSPRPNNVHILPITELIGGRGPGAGGAATAAGARGGRAASGLPSGVAGEDRDREREGQDGSKHTAWPFAPGGEAKLAQCGPASKAGPGQEAGAGSSRGAQQQAPAAGPGQGQVHGDGGGGAGLFAVAAPDDLESCSGGLPDWPQPAAVPGRKLRMELLYEDDNYRMDLLVQHLLACRPSTRSTASRERPRSTRGRPATGTAASGRPGARGPPLSRPVSAAAAGPGVRQQRPRSRSVSHLQRLQNVYGAGVSHAAVAGQYGSRAGGGASVSGEDGGRTGAAPDGAQWAGSTGLAMSMDSWDARLGDMERGGGRSKVGAGGGGGYWLQADESGSGARHSQLRPLSAPRTRRYM